MSRSIALVSMILVMSVTTPNAEATRYVVEPVALSDGYAITGGFIETDTIGPLRPIDITDYLITVEGEVPHVFSPSNPGASISIHGGPVLAIDGQIILPPPPAGADFGDHVDLHFSSSSTSVHCVPGDRCGAGLIYANGYDLFLSPHIGYNHSGIPDVDGDIWTSNQPRIYVPGQTTIVLARVPEPSTVTLFFLGVCVFTTRRQRKA